MFVVTGEGDVDVVVGLAYVHLGLQLAEGLLALFGGRGFPGRGAGAALRLGGFRRRLRLARLAGLAGLAASARGAGGGALVEEAALVELLEPWAATRTAPDVARALGLIGCCEPSRAAAILKSDGLVDPAEPRIVA